MPIERSILVADDDEAIQFCLEDLSHQEGWKITFANNGEDCLEKMAKENPKLLILDQRMPKMTGEEVLMALSRREKNPPVILISAEKDLSRMRRFPFLVKVMTKPFELGEFVALVNQYLPQEGAGQL